MFTARSRKEDKTAPFHPFWLLWFLVKHNHKYNQGAQVTARASQRMEQRAAQICSVLPFVLLV